MELKTVMKSTSGDSKLRRIAVLEDVLERNKEAMNQLDSLKGSMDALFNRLGHLADGPVKALRELAEDSNSENSKPRVKKVFDLDRFLDRLLNCFFIAMLAFFFVFAGFGMVMITILAFK